MDRVFSVGMAVFIVACFLFMIWFASDILDIDGHERSLAQGIAAVGGPLGMGGGIGLIAVVSLAVFGLQELLNLWMGHTFVRFLRSQEKTLAEIDAKIDRLPVTRGLKRRLKAFERKLEEA